MTQDIKARVEKTHLEALDTIQAINEITEWDVATTSSVKILGELISRQNDIIKELTAREEKLVAIIRKYSDTFEYDNETATMLQELGLGE